jgi:hypothetical protein
MTQPPRAAERLLRWSLADDERDAVLGDLHEEFAVISRLRPAHAVRWYWSQAALSVGPNLVRRIRRRTADARRSETYEERKARLKARKWGVVLLGGSAASMLGWTHPGFGEPSQLYFAAIGAVLFLGSFVPLSVDRGTAAIRARRWLLFTLGYWFTLLPEKLFGRTPFVMRVEWLLLVSGWAFLFWPEKYWIFGFTRVAPLAPQVRSPFVGLHRARDGSLSLAIDAPDTPASLGDPILARAGDSGIGIERVYSNRDALRVFSVVGQGAIPPRVNIELLDARGLVRRSVSPPLAPADLIRGNAPVRDPKVPLAQIDATVSLENFRPGRYVLRLTASDKTQRFEKYAEFDIRD